MTENTTQAPGWLSTTDLATVRGLTTTAVRQAAKRTPPGAPVPDMGMQGRGRPWRWRADRPDVQAYLLPPDQLAEEAEKVRARVGSTSGAARTVGVDRSTFVRVLRAQGWSTFTTAVRVVRAAGDRG